MALAPRKLLLVCAVAIAAGVVFWLVPVTWVATAYISLALASLLGLATLRWRRRAFRGVTRASLIALAACAALQAQRTHSTPLATLTGLPDPDGRWLNRLLPERDLVLLSSAFGDVFGPIPEPERRGLTPRLLGAYRDIEQLDGALPTPLLATHLGLQSPQQFDLIAFEPAETAHGARAKTALVFLHGRTGNDLLRCWLLAQPVRRIGGLTLCPSSARGKPWDDAAGRQTLHQTLQFAWLRGISRVFLAGVGEAGAEAQRLSREYEAVLSGLILIAGCDPALGSKLDALIVHGQSDGRQSIASARNCSRRFAQAGARAELRELAGGRLLLVQQRAAVDRAIHAWLETQP